jgi:hypothetical protein
MNRFLSLLRLARQNGWCTRPYCTTCAATDFRTALRQFGAELADDLAALDLMALEETSGWEDALRLALDELKSPDLKDRVLTMWLSQIDRHIRLADLVLFYYVRRGAVFAPMSIEVLQQWSAKCIDLASQTSDESLVESLICTLGRYKDYPELDAVVTDLVARGSQRVSLALRRQVQPN